MHYFNCGCGTVRPQRPSETIYTLYLLVNEDADENKMIIDLYIPFPWCHLIQHLEVVSPSFYVHSSTSREFVNSRRRLPLGATFITMCNEHTLFVKPL